MTTLLLRDHASIVPARSPATRKSPTAPPVAAHWMTPEIRRNLSVRARRLLRSGD